MSTLYLAHHGILGQKWGVRRFQNKDGSLTSAGKARARMDTEKGNKWASSKHQPSSIKSSIAAGIYAANPNNQNAKRLDKFNSADEARYKAAREYASKNKQSVGIYGGKLTKTQKAVGAIGGAIVLKSIADTHTNWKAANALVEGYAKIPVSKLITSSALQAGKFALGTGGAMYTVGKIGDSMRQKRYTKEYDNPIAKARKNANKNVSVNPTKTAQKNASKAMSEIDKLMSKNSGLKSDFGGSSKMIDDPEYFEYVARTQYGLNTNELQKYL